jgi:2-methylcitrate synthase
MAESGIQTGLRGVVAGTTSLSSVGAGGDNLRYRGYDVEDLAQHALFEETAHLLIHGHLPMQAELDAFLTRLRGMRALPPQLRDVLERIPGDAHPMDVLRTGCSMLGTLYPERTFAAQDAAAERLLASLPSILAYWYRFTKFNERIETATPDATIAGQVLRLLTGREPSQEHQRFMEASLTLYAEHEFNASTFTARVIA